METTTNRPARTEAWAITGWVFSIIAVIAAVFAVGLGSRAVDESKRNVRSGGPAAAVPATMLVHLSEFKVEPAKITIAGGGTLQLMNMGSVPHNLAVKGTALASPMVDAGGVGNLELTGLAAGTYTVICQVAGHEQSGMTAALHVVDSPAANTVTNAAPATPAMSAAEMDAAMAKSIKAFPAKTEGVGAQPLAPNVLADGTKQFTLTAKIVKWEVEAGKTVDAWTYNGTVPGPTIHVDPGDRISVVLKNELTESTAIHFHGLVTPNSMDGVPEITQAPVKPGETFTYSFTAQSTPAVGMYHSHQDAVKQVPNGRAGAILVHPMHLHGMAQLVVAKDGYPVPQPYDADTILVGPGERYTVLVHADNPGVWAWHCHILSHAENDQGMFGMVTALVVKA